MSFLKRWFDKFKGAPPREMVFTPLQGSGPGLGAGLEADKCYVELHLESLRLDQGRKFLTKFDGLVYAFLEMARTGDVNAELAAVSRPDKLTGLDDSSLGKVITVSKRLTSGVPWRGGSIELELGLFSVKSGNLLTPVLGYVTKVASTAGAAFIGTAKPFLPLIEEGMDLIAGQQNDTALLVGVSTSVAPATSGLFAVIAADKAGLDTTQLTFDEKDRHLLLDGRPLDEGYFIFSLRHALTKPDFGEIPELKSAYADFNSQVRDGTIDQAKEALARLKRVSLTSPDLIREDALKIVSKAEGILKDAFPAGGVAAGPRKLPPATLGEIGLYE